MADLPAEPRPIAEISHGPSASEQFLEKNQKLLIVIAVALAIVAAGIVVKRGIDDAAKLAAGAALGDAKDVAAMQDVIKNHAGTDSEASAAVLLSDLQWEQGQQSAALETLKSLIDSQPDHPATLPARARLAARLREQGDTAAAKDLFNAIVSDPQATWLAPYALISLADIAREEGDIENAKKFLAQISEDFPTSVFGDSAGKLRQFIDFQAPTEVEPPADETPAETDTGLPTPEPNNDSALVPSDGPANPLLDALNDNSTEEVETPADEPAAGDSGEPAPPVEAPESGGE